MPITDRQREQCTNQSLSSIERRKLQLTLHLNAFNRESLISLAHCSSIDDDDGEMNTEAKTTMIIELEVLRNRSAGKLLTDSFHSMRQ